MLLQNRKSLKGAAAIAVACCTVLSSLALAQFRTRKLPEGEQTEQPAPKRHAGKTPRALGVLEITGGDARLVPVSILIDGKFYDASVYKADPQPMAVEPETVYEGQKTGDPVGLFTVTRTQEVNGNWVGVGVWELKRPGDSSAPKEVKVGAQQSDRPRGMDDDEGPPKLRRPGSSSADKTAPTTGGPAPASTPNSTATNTQASAQNAPSTSSGTAAPASEKTASSDQTSAEAKPSGRPTLTRRGETPDTATTESTSTAQTDNKPTAQAESKPAAEASAKPGDEGGRPVLRRGNAGGEQADKIPSPKTAVAKGAAVGDTKSGKMHAPVGYTDTLAAISDAGGPTSRGFTMLLKPDERAGYEQKMNQYASEAIRKFAVTHPIRDRQAPNVALTDIQMRVFDVNSSNEPVLVLTARAPESAAASAPTKPAVRATRSKTSPGTQGVPHPSPSAEGAPTAQGSTTDFQYYITVVARVDVNGEVRKLFDSVTDTSHLDAVPRLQLIDCVDANGDGVGELLFRENYDRSRAFAIYRVGMDQLWQLFEGAQASFSAGQ